MVIKNIFLLAYLITVQPLIAGEVFSSAWLRTYIDPFSGNFWEIQVDKETRKTVVESKGDQQLIVFTLPNDMLLDQIAFNKDGKKAVIVLSKEEGNAGGPERLLFTDKSGSVAACSTEIGGSSKRIFVTEIASVSKSGQYLIAKCGVYQSRSDGFVVIYQWQILDLFDQCAIVGRGVDDWVKFMTK